MEQCPYRGQPNPPSAQFALGHQAYLCMTAAQLERHILGALVVLQSVEQGQHTLAIMDLHYMLFTTFNMHTAMGKDLPLENSVLQ